MSVSSSLMSVLIHEDIMPASISAPPLGTPNICEVYLLSVLIHEAIMLAFTSAPPLGTPNICELQSAECPNT